MWPHLYGGGAELASMHIHLCWSWTCGSNHDSCVGAAVLQMSPQSFAQRTRSLLPWECRWYGPNETDFQRGFIEVQTRAVRARTRTWMTTNGTSDTAVVVLSSRVAALDLWLDAWFSYGYGYGYGMGMGMGSSTEPGKAYRWACLSSRLLLKPLLGLVLPEHSCCHASILCKLHGLPM